VQRTIYAHSLCGRALCLDALGREAEAERAWEDHRAFTGEDLLRSRFRAVCWAKNGHPERGFRLAEDWLHQRDGRDKRFDAACVYAMASASPALKSALKKQYADRAIALLDECRANGFFRDANHIACARSDEFLNPLRGREDFKKLLAGLDASEKNGKE
jgi:hypothetical protein